MIGRASRGISASLWPNFLTTVAHSGMWLTKVSVILHITHTLSITVTIILKGTLDSSLVLTRHLILRMLNQLAHPLMPVLRVFILLLSFSL
jgi:hypothetical protein